MQQIKQESLWSSQAIEPSGTNKNTELTLTSPESTILPMSEVTHPEYQALLEIHRNNLSEIHQMLSTERTNNTYSTWLLTSFSAENVWGFSPLTIDHKTDPLTYFASSMTELSQEDQETTKLGISQAITSWDPTIYTPDALKDISYFALYTDTREAIEKIAKKIKDRSTTDSETVASLIRVMTAFTDYDLLAPKPALLSLYEDENSHPEFTPNLAIAIASITPSEYPSFLERFLSYEEYYKSTREPEFVDNALRSFIRQTMEMHGEQEAWEIIQSRFSTLPVDIVLRLQTQYDKIMQDIAED